MRGRQDFASAPHRGVHPLNDLSLLRLILEATVVVQLVMLLLLAASVYAWAVVFRKRAVLRRARDTLARFERDRLDSLLSAVRTKRFFWQDDASPINYDPLHRPRRQDFAGTLMENGAFYITRRTILEQYRCRLGGRIGIHEMPERNALEIDEPEDWARVEALLHREAPH